MGSPGVLSLKRSATGLVVAALLWPAGSEAARVSADSVGRIVPLPDEVERVFPAGPAAAVALYVLAPETLVGWTDGFQEDGAAVLVAEPYRDLPVIGPITAAGGADLAAAVAAAPDLILDYGSLDPAYIALGDDVQGRANLPYAIVGASLEELPAGVRKLGEILGRKERAEEIAGYAEGVLAESDAFMASVPEGHRPRVYLARGADGLETGARGSLESEIIERIAVNVAEAAGLEGVVAVSTDQVRAWNPEVIVTADQDFYARVWDHPAWQNVDAVQNERIWLSPTEPFGWINRPASLNRLLGLPWLASVLYPDRFQGDLRARTREFYDLFYHLKLSDDEVDRLLAGPG